jgi:hypothetical protein
MALSGAIASIFNSTVSASTSADTDSSTPSSNSDLTDTSNDDFIRYLPDPDAEKAPIQQLSNELLTDIIRNLDPPTAVCMALSWKQFYQVVPAACGVSLGEICPPFENTPDSNRPLLAPYSAPEGRLIDQAAFRAAYEILKRQIYLLADNRVLPELVLTPAYADLTERINIDGDYMEDYWRCRSDGHYSYPLGIDTWNCMMCFQRTCVESGRCMDRKSTERDQWALLERDIRDENECWNPTSVELVTWI